MTVGALRFRVGLLLLVRYAPSSIEHRGLLIPGEQQNYMWFGDMSIGGNDPARWRLQRLESGKTRCTRGRTDLFMHRVHPKAFPQGDQRPFYHPKPNESVALYFIPTVYQQCTNAPLVQVVPFFKPSFCMLFVDSKSAGPGFKS